MLIKIIHFSQLQLIFMGAINLSLSYNIVRIKLSFLEKTKSLKINEVIKKIIVCAETYVN